MWQWVFAILLFTPSLVLGKPDIFFSDLENKSPEFQLKAIQARLQIDSKRKYGLNTQETVYRYLELEKDFLKATDFLLDVIKNSENATFRRMASVFLQPECPEPQCLDYITMIMNLPDQELRNVYLKNKLNSLTLRSFYPRHHGRTEITDFFSWVLENKKGQLFKVLNLAIDYGFYSFSEKLFEKFAQDLRDDKWIYFKSCIVKYLKGNLAQSLQCLKVNQGMYFQMRAFYVTHLVGDKSPNAIQKLNYFSKQLSAADNIWFKPTLIKLLIGERISKPEIERLLSSKVFNFYKEGYLFIKLDQKYNYFNEAQSQLFKNQYLEKFGSSFLGSLVDKSTDHSTLTTLFGPHAMLSVASNKGK